MSEVFIKTEGLTKTMKGQTVLNGVDLVLENGRVYGLIGPYGSGKTELIDVLSGVSRADGGTMELFGGKEEKDLQKARRRIGFVAEMPSCINTVTAEQNLLSSLCLWEDRLKKEETWAGKAGYLPGRDGRRAWVWRVMELAGLPEQAERVRKLANYAPGPKRQFALAEALLGAPELLVADDIMEGTNLHGAVVMQQILRNLVEEYGVTLLLTGDGIRELYGIVTDYLYMEEGRIVRTLTKAELESACGQQFTVTCANMEYAERLLKEMAEGNVAFEPAVIPEGKTEADMAERELRGTLHVESLLLTEKEIRDRLTSCGIREVETTKSGLNLVEFYEELKRGAKA